MSASAVMLKLSTSLLAQTAICAKPATCENKTRAVGVGIHLVETACGLRILSAVLEETYDENPTETIR
jgi:hypothetical protein